MKELHNCDETVSMNTFTNGIESVSHKDLQCDNPPEAVTAELYIA